MSFGLLELAVPILGAPMAGGPTTPALAAAVSGAGGVGFLAAGYLSAARLAEDISAARAATSAPLGVNLFVPQPSTARADELATYRTALQPLADTYGAEVGPARFDDDSWTDKLEVVAQLRPEVVSFTFSLPSSAEIARLRGLGILVLATVTTAVEAAQAVGVGADGLVLQGPLAGGHRGTLAPEAMPADQSLVDLLAAVRQQHGVPVVAAGGLSTADDIADVLARGADAVQVGTALLLAEEAGTNAAHRAALSDRAFSETVVTRAFSGRYARGLRNDFTRRFDDAAPFGYPEVHYMTSPIRKAAVAAGDPNGTNLWAGTGFASARPLPAADIIAGLAAR